MEQSGKLRFAILGAGGIGGYYAGMLARAGHHVSILARGENLDALRQQLEVRVTGEKFTVQVQPSDDVGDFKKIDCAIVAVKTYSLINIAPAAKFLAEREALILPLLNGVENSQRLVEWGVPQEKVLGGLTAISAVRVASGVFERRSSFQKITFGQMPGITERGIADRLELIANAFRGSGIDSDVTTDITTELWRKFAFIASTAATCGLARCAIGPLRSRPLGLLLIERALREVVAVANSQGVTFRDREVERMISFINNLPEGMKPSFLLDLESGGPTELDDLSGAVSRFGRIGKVDTPIHDTAVAALSR
jgi:2-dehydropantoate 2-reductase